MERSSAKIFLDQSGYLEMMDYLDDIPEEKRDASLSAFIDFLSSVVV